MTGRGIPAAVADCIPAGLADRLAGLREDQGTQVEEIRLRTGYPMSVVLADGERGLGGSPVKEGDLRELLERASQASVHTVLDRIKEGFVTIQGGHRIGLCGTASCVGGSVTSLRYLSSASIRIARAVEGQAMELLPRLMEGDCFLDTLVLGPPGSGKTTLLRDLICTLSDGKGVRPHRVGVADERGELAALYRGIPQFSVGAHTDVLDGCPKGTALSILLRGMNPQVVAVDEITRDDDARAMLDAVGCGVALLATAHGHRVEDLERRPIYRQLMRHRVFRRVILVENHGGRRIFRVEVLS